MARILTPDQIARLDELAVKRTSKEWEAQAVICRRKIHQAMLADQLSTMREWVAMLEVTKKRARRARLLEHRARAAEAACVAI
jgi:hypothetical protein